MKKKNKVTDELLLKPPNSINFSYKHMSRMDSMSVDQAPEGKSITYVTPNIVHIGKMPFI